jgi:hypothetical protein
MIFRSYSTNNSLTLIVPKLFLFPIINKLKGRLCINESADLIRPEYWNRKKVCHCFFGDQFLVKFLKK